MRSKRPKATKWEEWASRCGFTRIEDAYTALGLTRGAYYRQSQKDPTLTVSLAMAAIYHRLKPYKE